MGRRLSSALALLTALTVLAWPHAASASPVVVLPGGAGLMGAFDATTRVFHAVPYARPPVGNLRWRPPAPPMGWQGMRDATRPSPRCPGTTRAGGEDCLYLQITAPTNVRTPLPVIVWLRGDDDADHDARHLAAHGDVVVVQADTRRGIFANFAHPALPESGTFGLLDAQAALVWVRENIAAFDGDPTTITLAGEADVCAHLASPDAAGLFQRAVIRSGVCTWDVPATALGPGRAATPSWTPLAEAAALGEATAASVCADATDALACLRDLPPDRLTGFTPRFPVPAHGGRALPRHPYDAIREGTIHAVPVLSGTTRDEARAQAVAHVLTGEFDYPALLTTAFGDRAPDVLARYPASADEHPALAWSRAMTDRVYTCPAAERHRLLAAVAPTYAYEFADPYAPSAFPEFTGFPDGAAHGFDVPYLLDGPDGNDAQRHMSDQMAGYWAAFAAMGDPNDPGLPAWPRFTTGETLRLVPEDVRAVDVGAERGCGFWAG